MSDTPPEPPSHLPDSFIQEADALDRRELRSAMHYLRQLIDHQHDPITDEIQAREGEEIVRITEHDGYTEVVKLEPCGRDGCEDCPHGPYLYHVQRESHPDGSEELHWRFLGEAES